MTKSATVSKKPRKQHSPEFRSEALKLAERIGVAAAARTQPLRVSAIYLAQQITATKTSSERENELAAENARLKRQLAGVTRSWLSSKRPRHTSRSA
jgi:transposase